MSRRDDDDDKYNKAKRGGRPVAYSAAKAPSSARGGSSMGGARGGTSFSSSQSVSSSPAQFGGFGGDDDADALAAKVRAKLDFVSTRAGADDEETEAERVKASLDRLAFASQVKGVRSAFGSAINDAASEIDGLASKAEETVASFQAMQYAAKWMPVDTRLSMKPTYVKVPVQAVERIKFWESEKLAMIVSQHAEEKEKILAENAGLRSMMGLEEANSPAVETMRETEDGVNRALLLSAVEEIKQLRTRITVLEGEAARSRISSSGFGSFFGGGNEGGVDSAQMSKLTTELARLEEDNGRQKWMIGEKDKQIKEVQGKYAASAAYKLQEKLQESMEALEVMANLQAEQLQYMEDHALRKLDAQDTQIADVQDDLDVKRAHLAQLKTLMKGYWETGDDSLVPPMLSLAGFSKKEAIAIDASRESLATAGLGGLVRGLGRRGYGFYEKFLVACAPPRTSRGAVTDLPDRMTRQVARTRARRRPPRRPRRRGWRTTSQARLGSPPRRRLRRKIYSPPRKTSPSPRLPPRRRRLTTRRGSRTMTPSPSRRRPRTPRRESPRWGSQRNLQRCQRWPTLRLNPSPLPSRGAGRTRPRRRR